MSWIPRSDIAVPSREELPFRIAREKQKLHLLLQKVEFIHLSLRKTLVENCCTFSSSSLDIDSRTLNAKIALIIFWKCDWFFEKWFCYKKRDSICHCPRSCVDSTEAICLKLEYDQQRLFTISILFSVTYIEQFIKWKVQTC